MGTILSVTCDFIKGTPPGLTEVVETWRNAGYDGYAAQSMGKGGGQFQLKLINFDTPNLNDTWIAAIEALAGETGSLVYTQAEWYGQAGGKTFASLLIKSVSNAARKAVYTNGSLKDRAEIVVTGVVYA